MTDEIDVRKVALAAVVVVIVIAVIFFLLNPAEKPPVKPDLTLAEKEAFGDAIEGGNKGTCAIIVDQAQRQECEKTANDAALYDQAIESKDPSICDQIATEEILEACQNLLKDDIPTVVREI